MAKRYVFLVSLILLIEPSLAIAQVSTTLSDRVEIGYPSVGGLSVGQGVNIRDLSPMPTDCIVSGERVETINSNQISFRHVVDKNSFAKSLNVSAQARVSAIGGSGGGSANYSRSVKLREQDTNIVAQGVVRTKAISVTPVSLTDTYVGKPDENTTIRLTSRAEGLFNGPDGGLQKFRAECGDYFVYTVVYGGAFDAHLNIRDTSRTERTELRSSLSGSYGMVSFSASSSEIVERIKSQNRLNIDYRSEGAELTTNPILASSFIEKIESFPSSVDGKAKPLTLVLASYKNLDGYPDDGGQILEMDALVDLYYELETLQAKAQEVAENTQNYVSFGPSDLVTERPDGTANYYEKISDEILKDMISLKASIEKCVDGNDSYCKIPEGIEVDDYEYRSKMPLPTHRWNILYYRDAIQAVLAPYPEDYIADVDLTGQGSMSYDLFKEKWPRNGPRANEHTIPLSTTSLPAVVWQNGAALFELKRCVDWMDKDANITALYIHDSLQYWVREASTIRGLIDPSERVLMPNMRYNSYLSKKFTEFGLTYGPKYLFQTLNSHLSDNCSSAVGSFWVAPSSPLVMGGGFIRP